MSKGTELFSLQGKIALITGATGYLGSAMAWAFAEAGAHVLINSRSEDRAANLVERLRLVGLSAEAAVFDVSSAEEMNCFFSTLENSSLHILVNNAYHGVAGTIESSDSDSYQESYGVAMVAPHNLLNASLGHLRRAYHNAGDASVINIASMYGMVSPDIRVYDSPKGANPPFYGAAKAALIQWTRYAACEFGHEGIRVNAISPGAFPADSVQDTNPIFIKKLNNKIPMGRVGLSNEMKGPALFLASSASSYVNGTNLVVDGGWTSW